MSDKCERVHLDYPMLNVINAAKAWARGVRRETAEEHLRSDERRLFLQVQALRRHEQRRKKGEPESPNQPHQARYVPLEEEVRELAENVLPFDKPKRKRR